MARKMEVAEVSAQARQLGYGRTSLCVATIALATLPFGCKRQPEASTQNAKGSDAVAIAYALGGKGDMTYNDAASRGVVALRKAGLKVQEFEPATLDDYARGLDLLSTAGPSLLFCIGYLYEDPVNRVAPKYPHIKYVVLDGSVSATNVWSIKFNATEGSFLAGAVAAQLTKTKKVAFVGGSNIPIINEFLSGYTEGIHFLQPDVEVLALYVGSGGTAFTDPVRGREVALTALSQGADVFYHAAGSSGNGVIEAAKEKGAIAIGVDVDQSGLAPGTVVTSMLKNFDVAMLYMVERSRDAQLGAGSSLVLGLAENAVSLAPMEREILPKVESGLAKAKAHLSKQ